jgi:hypothetical protein
MEEYLQFLGMRLVERRSAACSSRADVADRTAALEGLVPSERTVR